VVVLSHFSEVDVVVNFFLFVDDEASNIQKLLMCIQVLSWDALLPLKPTGIKAGFFLFTLCGFIVDDFF